jgi:hypothetical protein
VIEVASDLLEFDEAVVMLAVKEDGFAFVYNPKRPNGNRRND